MSELRQKYDAVMRAIDDLLNVQCDVEDKVEAVGEIIDWLEPKITELRNRLFDETVANRQGEDGEL